MGRREKVSFLLILFFNFTLTGCFLNSNISQLSEIAKNDGPTATPPEEPSIPTPEPPLDPDQNDPSQTLKQLTDFGGSPAFLGSAELNNGLILAGSDITRGRELWRFDYHTQEVSLIADLSPGISSSSPEGFLKSGSKVFFVAYDTNSIKQIWVTDGTLAGTLKLTQMPAGAIVTLALSPTSFGIFFCVDDGIHGVEPWKSDGTVLGTRMVADINPGSGNSVSSGTYFTEVGTTGNYVFEAASVAYDDELWITNGEASGTSILLNIETSPGMGSNPYQFVKLGTKVIFNATTTTQGTEPWITDGTTLGTVILKDIRNASLASIPQFFSKVIGSDLYFVARDPDYQLWKTDGTTVGTTKVSTAILTYPYYFQKAGDYVFHSGNGGSGPGIYAYKLSNATNYFIGATFGGEFNFSFGVEMGGSFYLSAYGMATGYEIYKIDLATRAFTLLKDIYPGTTSSILNSTSLIAVGPNRFVFLAIDSTSGQELWSSDGTPGGTNRVADISPGSERTAFSDILSFTNPTTGDHYSLFGLAPQLGNSKLHIYSGANQTISEVTPSLRVDSTSGGTGLSRILNSLMVLTPLINGYSILASVDTVSEAITIIPSTLRPGTSLNHLYYFGKSESHLYFNQTLSDGNEVVSMTDGTVLGTTVLKDPNTAATLGGVSLLGWLNNTLLFSGKDATLGTELWSSDGTTSGTQILKDLTAGASNSGFFGEPGVQLGNDLIFTAYVGSGGFELWKTDGTALGTSQIIDLNPGIGSGAVFMGFKDALVLGNFLYFRGDNGSSGMELWRTDGTAVGTTLVKNINQTSAFATSSPSYFVKISDSKFVFLANDGVNAAELWVSDGTSGGTNMIADIAPGNVSSVSSTLDENNFLSVSGKMIFFAHDGVHGNEPWVTDGTPGGTKLLKDIKPGLLSSATNFRIVNDGEYAYFIADNGTSGLELWRSDGTEQGTSLFFESVSGPMSLLSNVDRVVGNYLYLLMTSPHGSIELGKIQIK